MIDDKINYLNGYIESKHKIDSIQKQIDEWEARKYSLGGGMGAMPEQPNNKNKMLEVLSKLDELTDKFLKELEQSLINLDNITKSIDGLEDSTLRTILRYRYINDFGFSRIAILTYYSTTHVHRMHSKAVEEIKIYN